MFDEVTEGFLFEVSAIVNSGSWVAGYGCGSHSSDEADPHETLPFNSSEYRALGRAEMTVLAKVDNVVKRAVAIG